MTTRRPQRVLLVSALAGIAPIIQAAALAAPFVNLNFEESTVQHNDPPIVPAGVAFPGWTPRLGNSVLSSVYLDYAGGGEGAVVICDGPSPLGDVQLEGQFMAMLIRDIAFQTIASLEQVGDIPAGTRSLQLVCNASRGPPIVTLNGMAIPLVYLSGIPIGNNPVTFGGDVTAFAGTTAALRLQSPPGLTVMDDIRFSTMPIPEPSSLLPVLSGVFLLARTRPRQRTG